MSNRDFFNLLNSSNSEKDEKTGDIIITSQIKSKNEVINISSPCSITSNCNAIFNIDELEINSSNVFFSNIIFDGIVTIMNTEKVSFSNCSFLTDKATKSSLWIQNSKFISLDHIDISGNYEDCGIYISNSKVIADYITVHDISETLIGIHKNSTLTLTNSNLFKSQSNGIYADGQT